MKNLLPNPYQKTILQSLYKVTNLFTTLQIFQHSTFNMAKATLLLKVSVVMVFALWSNLGAAIEVAESGNGQPEKIRQSHLYRPNVNASSTNVSPVRSLAVTLANWRKICTCLYVFCLCQCPCQTCQC